MALQPETATMHRMQCMEIWGGNTAADGTISVTGIDAWIYSEPHNGETTGGDIHYVSMCGGGRIVRFAIADVSGHGSSASRFADILRGLMRKYINTVNQARFARALNREFTSLSSDGTFATALLATYFSPTDQLILVNAGHPEPLWYRPSTGRWQRLHHKMLDRVTSRSNLPLGIVQPTRYHQFAVRLEPDDLVLIYTDSLVETRVESGALLGVDGLLKLLDSLNTVPPDRLSRAVLERLAQHRGTQVAEDDVTLLLLRHNGGEPARKSAAQWARVFGRLLGLIRV